MAHPIELGLVLEGEDAKEFLEDLRNPKATKEQIEMFKEAIRALQRASFLICYDYTFSGTTHRSSGKRP